MNVVSTNSAHKAVSGPVSSQPQPNGCGSITQASAHSNVQSVESSHTSNSKKDVPLVPSAKTTDPKPEASSEK